MRSLQILVLELQTAPACATSSQTAAPPALPSVVKQLRGGQRPSGSRLVRPDRAKLPMTQHVLPAPMLLALLLASALRASVELPNPQDKVTRKCLRVLVCS